MMAPTVYFLCALTSLLVAVLLFRAYRRTPNRLLFWSSISFGGFFLNNVLLFVDLVIFPVEISLVPYRSVTCIIALSVLIYGLIWDTV